MKSLKVVLVVLVLCFAFVGVTNLKKEKTSESKTQIEKSEVKHYVELGKGKLKKPSNA